MLAVENDQPTGGSTPPPHLPYLISGFAAGSLGTLLGYPFDVCKVKMQTDFRGYPSLGKAFGRIAREEGLKGFYRGVGAPLTALTILNSLAFSIFAETKALVGAPEQAPRKFEPRIALAALMITPFTAVISTPFELLKTQMVMRPSSYLGLNFLQSAAHIARAHGPRALYTAHVVNTAREGLFLASYFTGYEHLKGMGEQLLPAPIVVPLSGGIAGAASWFITFPLDLIKGNIQAQPLDVALSPSHLTAGRLARDLIRSRGILGFYSGVAPSLIRAFIVSSSRFAAYEGMLCLINRFS